MLSLSYCVSCFLKYYVKFISFIFGLILAVSLTVNHSKKKIKSKLFNELSFTSETFFGGAGGSHVQ